jgi:predicted dehydrogenase
MRFGFVGLGTATSALHLPALRRVRGATLVGGCDPSEERRAGFERRAGAPAYATLEELVERARLDAVVVAAPPAAHSELCMEALGHGLHVLCEKPLATSLAEADRVLEEAAREKRCLAVHHGFREQPIFRALRERIDSADVGRLAFCQVWQLMNLPPWEEQVAWRADMAQRTLLESGIHLVDLMLALFGGPPEAVYARHSSGFHSDREADAVQLLTLEFPEGRLGQLVLDRLCRGGDRYVEVRADCEHASLRASWGGRALLQVGKKRARRAGLRLELGAGGMAWLERGLSRRTIARDPRRPAIAGTVRLIEGFVAAAEEGREPPSSGSEARDALEVVEAAYRSAEAGARVPLGSAGGGFHQQGV